MQKHLPALTPVSGWVSEWLIVSDSGDSFRIYRACKHVQSVFSKLIFAKCTLLVHLISFRSWFFSCPSSSRPTVVIHTFIHGLTGRGYGVGRGRGAETLVWTAEKETMYHQQHHEPAPQSPPTWIQGNMSGSTSVTCCRAKGWVVLTYLWTYILQGVFFFTGTPHKSTNKLI